MKSFVVLSGLLTIVVCLIYAQAPQSPPCPNMTPPKVTYSPNAEPPSSWAGKKKAISTVVELTVDKKGRVREARILKPSGDADGDHENLRAAKSWRFKPAMCGKEPQEVQVKVTMNLVLR